MSQEHGRPDGAAEEPLYDVDVATPSHAERARTLLAAVRTGTLCTLAREPAGFPYGSFVTFAVHQGDPVFLISEMAEHTQNLRADRRCSLLAAEGGEDDPLANGRVTLVGRAEVVGDGDERQASRDVYLETHPNARYFVDFRDFAFWKLRVEGVRYIGGYGRMSWVGVGEWRAAEPDPVAEFAAAVIQHMNDDHSDALVEFCRAFSRAADAPAAVMTGVDRYGFEMSVETARGPRPVRLAFPEPIRTADDARRQMVAMVRLARERTRGA